MDIRYFAIFDDSGNRTESYVADGMPYSVTDIISAHPTAIEVSAENWAKILQGYVYENGTYVLHDKTFDEKKEIVINNINHCAKEKLVNSDHELLEFIEMNDLTNKDYINLKLSRQNIRSKRDELIKCVNECTTENELNNITIKF